jgi:hypothetical protein
MTASPTAVRATAGGAIPTVLLAGALSTALALVGVWAIARFTDENVMGWYANYVLPVGPLLVGLVASSGFALGSYWSGAKITGPLLWMMLAILVAGYALGQWLEFRQLFPDGAVLDDGTELGFWGYFDLVTRSIAFTGRDKVAGRPLGALGYLVRVGDLVGFTAGGLLVPFGLRKLPYCATCAAYMRRPVVALLAADVPRKRIAKKDAAALAAHEASRQEARSRAEAGLTRLYQVAGGGDGAAFSAAVAEVGPLSARRATHRLDSRLQVRAVHCRRCGAGELRTELVTGQGKQVRTRPLSSLPLERGVVARLLAAARRRG